MATISHLYKNPSSNRWEIQSNSEHCTAVATMAAEFASSFGFGDVAYLAGLLHDIGKDNPEWQKYIKAISGYSGEDYDISNRPNHAYAGAYVAKNAYSNYIGLIAAQAIYGHHAGLYDYEDFKEAMKKCERIPYDGVLPKASLNLSTLSLEDIHHVIRMVYSCLVDADSLDTERFYKPYVYGMRKKYTTLPEILSKVEAYVDSLACNSNGGIVDEVRQYVRSRCTEMSVQKPGIYSLTSSTGSGKTLSSVIWGLRHAIANNLERIIIVIPYTSIISQTSSILRGIVGEENVLEHHSLFDEETVISRTAKTLIHLATENWDMPIVVTTNVQFFESIFSSKRQKCRKIHNIAHSVVIFDEVQTFPIGFLHPILDSLRTFSKLFGTSFLLMSATMPVLTGRVGNTFDGLSNITEIIPEEYDMPTKLKRVETEEIGGKMDYDEIASRISRHDCVLCIVNTRKNAREIFSRLPKEDGITNIHLSKTMCSRHIMDKLDEIKTLLSSGLPVRVVSTQLVEAGVDISFPVVYREGAGVDSINQSAGRCNRNGLMEHLGKTYIFTLKNGVPRGFIANSNNARLAIGTNVDIFSPQTIREYYRQLYLRVDRKGYDKDEITKMLYILKPMLRDAGDKFKLIQTTEKPVVIIYDDIAKSLVSKLSENDGLTYDIARKLGMYTVQVTKSDFEKMEASGVIYSPIEGIYVLGKKDCYSPETGIDANGDILIV